jgi:hypothetical protein
MANPKKLAAPAAIALAYALGAGTHSLVTKANAVTAAPYALRMLGDGQVALAIHARQETKQGRRNNDREIVWAADGSAPRLNGKPMDDAIAAELGKETAAYVKTAADKVAKLAASWESP